MYSMGGMDMGMFGGTGETLVLNANHPLVQYVLGLSLIHIFFMCLLTQAVTMDFTKT